jgi:regulator of sirC expression with transglutaminase-like and TPR domain
MDLYATLDRLAADPFAPADLAALALHLAADEYRGLDVDSYLARLDRYAEELVPRLVGSLPDRVAELTHLLFEEEGFAGNVADYYDPRNSYLNDVLDRRTGIPITLCVVYMEVARRAGLHIDGVNFPGHFLVRCPEVGSRGSSGLIIDPFHGGALLSEHDCRLLLQRQVGSEVAFSKSLLAPTTRLQILVRMLINLKRIYVHMRSFPQARDVTELLLAMTPSALSELRDRGLLAYHLNDVTGALRDLQTYLKLSSLGELDKESREEQEQIWEHVKTLRRRVASLN